IFLNGKTMVTRSIALLSSLLVFGVPAAPAQIPKPTLDGSQISAYEGQNVTSVEVAGRPDLNPDRFAPTLGPAAGQPFSKDKAEATIRSLKASGSFEDVQ